MHYKVRFNKVFSTITLVNLIWLGCFVSTIVFLNFNVGAQAYSIFEHNFSTVSYLGSAGSDNIAGVETQLNGSIILAGTIPGNNFGVNPVNQDGGGDGIVFKFSSDGKSILNLTRVGNYIDDVDVSPNDTINLNTDKGVYKLSSNGKSLLWHDNFGSGGSGSETNGRRIAASRDGKVAALSNKQVRLYNPDGTVISTFSLSNSRVNDIAIDSASQTIFVVGDTQKDGAGCSQLRMAYIYGLSYTGQIKWRGFDFTKEQAASNDGCADTYLLRVYMGKDGRVYVAGTSAGGNSIFKKNPQDPTKDGPLAITDYFTDPYNTSSNNIGYFGKFWPYGVETRGQFLLSRLDSTKGNTINLKDIKIDGSGNVYVAGDSAYKFPGRDQVKINGQSLGAYVAGDSFVIKTSPDFKQRLKVFALTKGGGKNKTGYIATNKNTLVFAARTDGTGNGEILTTPDSIQPNRTGGSDIFYGVTTVN